MSPIKILQLAAAASLLAACSSSSEVVRVYNESAAVSSPFTNILVVASLDNASARRDFEVGFRDALQNAGTEARSSLELILSTEELNRESILGLVEQTDADAVLVTRLLDIETARRLEGGGSAVVVQRRNTVPFADFFRYDFVEYRDPLTVATVADVVIETDLFSVADETRIWTGRTQSLEKASVFELVANESRRLVRALGRDGLID